MGKRKGQHGGDAAQEIANVPEEEADGDEDGRLEENPAVLVHGKDLDGEDWEEHGDGEDEGHAESEPAELLEEVQQGDNFAGGALSFFDAGHGGGEVLCEAVGYQAVVSADQGDDSHEGHQGDDNSSKEIVKGRGLPGALACGCVFFARREEEHGDDLRDGRQNSGHALAYHESLHVLGSAKASGEGKRAVLHQARGPRGTCHHGEHKAQVLARRGIEKDGRGAREKAEDDGVDDEGEVDAEGVRGGVLDVGEDEGGDEVREGRDGEDGGLEVCFYPGVAGEAGCKVRGGGEEHVPVEELH